jgi:hypothetical protein
MRAGCAVFGSGELPARFRRVNLGMEQKFYRPPHVNFFPTIKGDWLRQPPRPAKYVRDRGNVPFARTAWPPDGGETFMRGSIMAFGTLRRSNRMSEKIDAAAKAGASLMAGASGDEIVRQYRKRVAANAKRLGKARTPRRRK